MEDCFIRNSTLVLPDRLMTDRYLVVRDGLIADITDDPSKCAGLPSVDGQGGCLVPSPAEIHFHGIGDYGFDQEDDSIVEKICRELLARGTACFVPGFTYHEPIIARCVKEIGLSRTLRDHIPGILVEGPFVSPARLGGIRREHVRKPDLDDLKRIMDLCDGMLRMMTVAPELEGIGAIIDHLFENGVIPCLGHSDCTVGQAMAAARRGPMSMTHLFNAMSPISHKDPGLALLPFLDREIYFELNGDGVHVAPEVLRMCHQGLNRERMILISDAVVSAGRAHGRYRYHGLGVVSDARGVRYEENGILIGSNLLILDVVRNFIGATGASLPDAMRMAALNPCRLLGIDGQRGSIAVGKKADLILVDKDLRVAKALAD